MEKKDPSQQPVYHFDVYTLNTETYELRQDNHVIEIEPKLFQILSALVQQHPRVVTKDELLHDIWDDRVVTANAISRAMYQLRKVIDSDDNRTLIKTIRGVGYQLDCEVKRQPIAMRNHNPKPANHQVLAHWLISALLLTSLAFVGYLLMSPKTDPEDKAIQAPQETLIAILPLQSDDVQRGYINLSNTLIDYLTIELQSGLGVRVIHPDRLTGLNNETNSIKTIQQETHATHILEGYVSAPKPNLMQLHLTLYRPTKAVNLEPYSLGVFDFPWPDNNKNLQALYKQRKLTVSEIAKLIQPEASMHVNQISQTADPMTFRLVIASHHSVINDQCQGVERATSLLQEAVSRDPEYAYAWHQLMAVYLKNIWLCGQSSNFYDKALTAANHVERLAPHRYPSVAIAKNAVLIETNRVEQAFAINQQHDDNQSKLMYLKVSNLRYAGFLQQAKTLMARIYQLDPYFYNAKPITYAPNTLLYLRQYEAHLAQLATPGNIYHDYYRALNLFVQGHVEQALTILKLHQQNNTETIFNRYADALYHIAQQDYDDALILTNEVVNLRQKQGQSDGEMTYKQAQLYAMVGDKNAALDQLELSLKQGFFPAQYWQNDPALSSVIHETRFASLFKQAQQRHHDFAEDFGLTPEF